MAEVETPSCRAISASGIPHSRASFQAKSDRILANQELNTGGFTGVIYWEGAVAGQGTSGGQKVSCEGYVELTGYAGSLGGLF